MEERREKRDERREEKDERGDEREFTLIVATPTPKLFSDIMNAHEGHFIILMPH